MRNPIETYFTHLRDIHASGAGVAKTSYYGLLATLLTESHLHAMSVSLTCGIASADDAAVGSGVQHT